MFLLWFVLGACILALAMAAWDWLAKTLPRRTDD